LSPTRSACSPGLRDGHPGQVIGGHLSYHPDGSRRARIQQHAEGALLRALEADSVVPITVMVHSPTQSGWNSFSRGRDLIVTKVSPGWEDVEKRTVVWAECLLNARASLPLGGLSHKRGHPLKDVAVVHMYSFLESWVGMEFVWISAELEHVARDGQSLGKHCRYHAPRPVPRTVCNSS